MRARAKQSRGGSREAAIVGKSEAAMWGATVAARWQGKKGDGNGQRRQQHGERLQQQDGRGGREMAAAKEGSSVGSNCSSKMAGEEGRWQ
ncbi:hypothetical protein BHE74_00033407 [Ensete ventricosum]|nr:hypothetical protein BHE74_00033407 [Ensete ventricosum]RZR82268.1 hypothetical protein BHM03_00008639 [Ensete ventricosum]